ncbi:hypothetical protein BY458DRAFT_533857 [Sporodiniella umbellata]|nr:hypothetical protein BY458DRAFT_533857 [Sporodiniella umbellata]
MNPHALVIGDIDNDDKNEFVIGNLSGDLAIFKGKCQDGYPSYICRGLGTNSVVVINAEGHAHIFDIPATHVKQQVSVDDYLKGGRRSSDTVSTLAYNRMASNSSYYTTAHEPATPSICDLEKPNLTLKVPVNVNKILIADIDNDSKNELILARTDRILHVFRLEPTPDTKKGTKEALSEVNMWVFDGQISSLCTTTHPDRPHESLLLVAQPGNTFTVIDKDGKRYNRDLSPQQHETPMVKTEDIGFVKDDTREITDEADNTFSRTNYVLRNWTENNGQTDESGAVATEIVIGKRHVSGNVSTNEIGMLSMDGKFSIYDLQKKTLSHRDLFVTHKLFSLATLDISKSPVRSSEVNMMKPSDAIPISNSQLNQSSGIEGDSEETESSSSSEDTSEASDSEFESWDEASEEDETPGCDLFVACAWNGVTYLIDWSRRIEDGKIKYQLVKFAFEGRVCAFTAGLYAVDSEENLPCLFYVDFEDQVYVYYDVWISSGPVSGFIDTIDDDVEEAIDRIIGIEGAIDSLIASELHPQSHGLQKKTTEEEEDTIDLGDGWRGVANEEECGFIKSNESDPLADIRRLSDLNVSIEPTLDDEIVSSTGSVLEEGASSNYLYSVARSEISSDEYDNDIHIASWIEGSLIASSIFKQEDNMSSEDD